MNPCTYCQRLPSGIPISQACIITRSTSIKTIESITIWALQNQGAPSVSFEYCPRHALVHVIDITAVITDSDVLAASDCQSGFTSVCTVSAPPGPPCANTPAEMYVFNSVRQLMNRTASPVVAFSSQAPSTILIVNDLQIFCESYFCACSGPIVHLWCNLFLSHPFHGAICGGYRIAQKSFTTGC